MRHCLYRRRKKKETITNNKKLWFVYSMENNAAIKNDATDLCLLICKDIKSIQIS